MAFLIPSHIQKRLLRYALSQLELVDTDALDLEQLDIAWGKRSSLELRDVGLHVKKFSKLLRLPDTLQPTKGRILSLKVTVPADLHRSGIQIEVKGVEVNVLVVKEKATTEGESPSSPQSVSTQDKGGLAVNFEDGHDALPSTKDVAKAFLEVEPVEERRELEAALLSQSKANLEESDNLSEYSDDGLETGTGIGLALPGFLSGFLKGIADRLVVTIKDVAFLLEFEVPSEHIPVPLRTEDDLPATLGLYVQSVDIEGLTSSVEAMQKTSPSEAEDANAPKKRQIVLRTIRADLISEGSFFTSLSRVSSRALSHSSPAMSRGIRSPSPLSSRSLGNSAIAVSHLRDQSSLAGSVHSSSSVGDECQPGLDLTEDDEDRFADASSDEDEEHGAYLADSIQVPFRPTRTVENSSPSDSGTSSPILDASLSNLLRQRSSLQSENMETSRTFPGELDVSALLASETSSPGHSGSRFATDPLQDEDSRRSQMPTSNAGTPASERPITDEPDSGGSSTSSSSLSGQEDLTESRFFTHEDAQSMYLSAMSEAAPQTVGETSSVSCPKEPQAHPGESEAADLSSSLPIRTLASPDAPEDSSCETPKPNSPVHDPISLAKFPPDQDISPTNLDRDRMEMDSSVTSSQRQPEDQTSDTLPIETKTFLTLDELSVWIPWVGENDHAAPGTVPVDAASDTPSIYQSQFENMGYKGMPGAFSFDGSSDLRRKERATDHSSIPKSANKSQPAVDPGSGSILAEHYDSSDQNYDIEVELGSIDSRMDLSAGRLLGLLVQQLLQSPRPPKKPDTSAAENNGTESSKDILILLKTKKVRISVMEHLTSTFESGLSGSDVTPLEGFPEALLILDASDNRFSFKKSALLTAASLDVRKFTLGFPGEHILSFDPSLSLQGTASSVSVKKTNDVSLKYVESKERGRELHLGTLPLRISLSMQKLDEKLSCFGGLSGVLDLSSSIASNSTILPSSPDRGHRNQSKTVRFHSPKTGTSTISSPSLKVNARLDGLLVKVDGRTCGISLQTSAVKAILRNAGVTVQISRIKLKGPLKESARQLPLLVDITNTKISVLFAPEECDLTQLVSLIMPTRDPYEDEDDILLDTLLRQRKKGSVIRGSISTVDIRVSDLDAMQELQRLGEELSKLSSVAKYLPDDERPGILSLLSVDKIRTEVFVSRTIGSLRATCKDTRLAHVGLPALFALELGTIGLLRNEDELIRPVLILRHEDQLPMLMARVIGDELEPTIKVKLFNFGAEYHVSTLLASMGLAQDSTTEDLAATMASSVATIREGVPSSSLIRQSSGVSDSTSRPSTKPLHLDLLLRDCAVGLNPDNEVSRGLILLTNARLSANASVKEPLKGTFDIRECSILAIDDVSLINGDAEPAPRARSLIGPSPACVDLSRQGYRALGSLSVATVTVQVEENDNEKPLLNVTVTNKLFVLETCADSTQTLIQIIDCLKPPTPPSAELHYHTDPMLPEELMKAFSGAAFEQPESNYSNASASSGGDDDGFDGLSGGFEVIGSFYDPSEKTPLRGGWSRDQDLHDYQLDASMSKLRSSPRETPFSRPSSLSFRHSPQNLPLKKVNNYVRNLRKSGAVHGWNSAANRYGTLSEVRRNDCPFRLHLEAGTVIWNLFDGYDWVKTREIIAQAVEEVQARAAKRRLERERLAVDDDDEESEIGDFLFQSIWIAVPPNRDEQDLRRRINREMDDITSETSTITTVPESRSTSRPVLKRNKSRRLKLDRSKRRKVSIEIHGLNVDVTVLPPGKAETQSSIDVRVGDLDIYDHVPSSTWRKFVTYMHDAGPRPYGKSIIHLELQTVKPKPDLAATELVIRATVSPLRLHVDQDTLDFITRFFEFKDDTRPPSNKPLDPPFIQRCEVRAVSLKLDYKPKKVDYGGLRSGHTKEFVNFIILDGAEIQLKRIIIFGISGFDRLHKILNDLWVADVTRNQLPTVLQGLAPLRPIVNVGNGVRDLIVIPMREYQKDGRIVRSIQKGAVAFARTTTSELARLGAKVAMGTGNILQGAETMLSPSSTGIQQNADQDDDSSNTPARRAVSNYANQPLTVASGLRSAVRNLEKDLMSTRDAIIAVGAEIRESESATDVARAVFRSAPAVILKPAIGTTKAIGTALLGAGNALDKDSRRKAEDKYK